MPPSRSDDFYVLAECCTACGIPVHVGPTLFAEDSTWTCFVKKQPTTTAEHAVMLRVLQAQDLDCIRYRGRDPAIVQRLHDAGVGSVAEMPLPRGRTAQQRVTVSFIATERTMPWTAREILEQFAAHESRTPRSLVATTDDEAYLTLEMMLEMMPESAVTVAARSQLGRWIVRHDASVWFSENLHRWLSASVLVHDVRWYSADELARGAWQRTPW